MPEQITLEEALKLVTFYKGIDGTWRIKDVKNTVDGIVEGSVFGDIKKSVLGNVEGNVLGNVEGSVFGGVRGDIWGSVFGNVFGTINDRKWQFIETPKEKLQRLIEAKGDQELLEAFNQLEDNDD